MSNPLIFVHGYLFDPWRATGHVDHPETFLYPLWRTMLARRDATGYAWYSKPTWREWLKEAYKGYTNRYQVAFSWAMGEGFALAGDIHLTGTRVDLVAHSLGTRVALTAIAAAPKDSVRRVILLNGAAHPHQAEAVMASRPNIEVLNIRVEEDDVLRHLGRPFSPQSGSCIGRVGLGSTAPDRWHDVCLDDPDTQSWGRARGYELDGDRAGWSDHHHSYRYQGNWGLYRDFLAGVITRWPSNL